jgi:hypothetical protein
MELRQAIDEAGQPLGGRVLPTVPERIVGWVMEAEIGAQVHDPLGQGGELLNTRGHLAVGKGREEHVARLQFLQAHQVKICPPPEVGVQEVGRLASVALRGSLLNLHLGMIQQQPQQFPSHVSRRTDDGCFQHRYPFLSNQKGTPPWTVRYSPRTGALSSDTAPWARAFGLCETLGFRKTPRV